jgi:predicted O-methyltransferase YrrM
MFFSDITETTERFETLGGVFSYVDRRVLYSIVRKLKPRTILEVGPREGATTSTIVSAIKRNGLETSYYIFEKDILYLEQLKENLKPYRCDAKFHFEGNVIDNPILEHIRNIDLLFIDGNHDYVFAQWYVKTLFPLLGANSVIHIHDLFYNRSGKGWDDIIMINARQQHPDIMDSNRLAELYPTLHTANPNPILYYEGDVVKDFYMKNQNQLEFLSTTEMTKGKVMPKYCDIDPGPCSIYFYVKEPKDLEL